MDKYGIGGNQTTFRIEGLMSKILRLKNINNNNGGGGDRNSSDQQEASFCELGSGGCHAMKPRDIQNEHKKFSDNYKEIVDENGKTENMAAGQLEETDDVPAARSNNSSSNNSTDNLSITDDEDDVEVLLLDNQQFAEDEISENSDDCVYAYRGADFDILEYRNNNVEDETDFLEMDFEPDPASEIDGTSACNGSGINFNSHQLNQHLPDPTAVDEFVLPFQMMDEINNKSTKSNPSQPPHCNDPNSTARNHHNISDGEDSEHFRFTGAKPKKNQQYDKVVTGKVSTPKNWQTSPTPDNKVAVFQSSPNRNHNISNGSDAVHGDADESCIDCLENEFLSTTIGRKLDTTKCRKCRKAINCKFMDSESYKPHRFSLDFSTDYSKILQKPNIVEANQPNGETFSQEQHTESVNLLKRVGKESVTFSSVNVDEKVIIQALDHINIDFNKDIIKRHFEAMNNEKPHLDNVTDLILYISKRNCDYKKIIKLIALACNEEVDIQFTRDENVSKETEIVQVRSCDILETWTIQSNLERLKKLNRKFVQMNVLGKVINLIRHAQQRNTKSIEEFIIVPQYYKTGYICITKK